MPAAAFKNSLEFFRPALVSHPTISLSLSLSLSPSPRNSPNNHMTSSHSGSDDLQTHPKAYQPVYAQIRAIVVIVTDTTDKREHWKNTFMAARSDYPSKLRGALVRESHRIPCCAHLKDGKVIIQPLPAVPGHGADQKPQQPRLHIDINVSLSEWPCRLT